jgi:hypothetical protein
MKKNWPMWASIVALVLAIISLCAGWFAPYVSLACPLIAIVLAAIGIKSGRKPLAIVALAVSIVSFLALATGGTILWVGMSQTAEGAQFNQSLGGLTGALGHLARSVGNLIQNMFH